ncbi:MAG: lysophospholipid acyltransferase family protein [Acidimicrobiaceae bacterium]|nr:lysophospholipid acyltransferase family protein [Acidimicrobiaceae bacterium]
MKKIYRFLLRAPATPEGVEPLPPQKRVGMHFNTSWARRWPARVGRFAGLEGPLRVAVWLFATPNRRGLENLDKVKGPVIFVANHHSHADTPLLLISLPMKIRHKTAVAAASDYFFKNKITGVVSALFIGAIPVDRKRVGRQSAKLSAELLAEGWNLLIYPEGGRSPDGWGQSFRGGAAYLSKRCNTPILPIHLSGTDRVLRKNTFIPRPAITTATFGKPIYPSTEERSAKLALRVEEAVNALADEIRTDWYTARKRAHGRQNPTLTGPAVSEWRRAWIRGDQSRKNKRPKNAWPVI